MKFLVPNYSCLQNPWLGGYRPQIPVPSVLCPQLNLLNPPWTKFLGTPLNTYTLIHIQLAHLYIHRQVSFYATVTFLKKSRKSNTKFLFKTAYILWVTELTLSYTVHEYTTSGYTGLNSTYVPYIHYTYIIYISIQYRVIPRLTSDPANEFFG